MKRPDRLGASLQSQLWVGFLVDYYHAYGCISTHRSHPAFPLHGLKTQLFHNTKQVLATELAADLDKNS